MLTFTNANLLSVNRIFVWRKIICMKRENKEMHSDLQLLHSAFTITNSLDDLCSLCKVQSVKSILVHLSHDKFDTIRFISNEKCFQFPWSFNFQSVCKREIIIIIKFHSLQICTDKCCWKPEKWKMWHRFQYTL